jgi:hypothetical protein
MPPALSRHDLAYMLAQGLSQWEISKRTGIPRSTMQRLLNVPQVPEVIPEGRPKVAPRRPLPQSLVEAGPVLLEMAASGKYIPQGLQAEERSLAATTAGQMRRTLDATHIQNNLLVARAQLTPTVEGDPSTRLLRFWQQMEVRATLERTGLTLIDPVTGSLRYDTLKFRALYEDALLRRDGLMQEALEQWPILGSQHPLDEELRAEGRAQRQRARDPIAAARLAELERLHEAYESTLADALQELPREVIDPLLEMAQGTPRAEASEG